jgi:hypothetical protein
MQTATEPRSRAPPSWHDSLSIVAATHHDYRIGGERLVYGVHTIGPAFAQITRRLPGFVAVLGWQSCDHDGPVHEGDTLFNEIHIETAFRGPTGVASRSPWEHSCSPLEPLVTPTGGFLIGDLRLCIGDAGCHDRWLKS